MITEYRFMGRLIGVLLSARLHCSLSERIVAGIVRPVYYCWVHDFYMKRTAAGVGLDPDSCSESVITGCPSLDAMARYYGHRMTDGALTPPYTLLRYRLHPTFKVVSSLAASGSLGMMDEDQGVRQFRLSLFGEEMNKAHLQSLEYCRVTVKNWDGCKRWHPMVIQGEGGEHVVGE